METVQLQQQTFNQSQNEKTNIYLTGITKLPYN